MRRFICLSVVFVCILTKSGLAQPVYFADANLKARVEATLGISNPTPTDMLGLTELYAGHENITDLTGLEYAVNLETLDLEGNQICDISALSGLTNLRFLARGGLRGQTELTQVWRTVQKGSLRSPRASELHLPAPGVWDGLIDDVRIYNIALSAEQISALIR